MQSGQNGPPQGMQPGQGGPPQGMGPGGAGGAAGGSPFSNSPEAGSAAAVVKQFYDKLMADETEGLAELFSSKAKGKAKTFRSGKASERVIAEIKEAITNTKQSMDKTVQGSHLIVLEENIAGAGGGFGAPQGAGGGRKKGKKLPKKVQFTVVNEGGKQLIQDIAIRAH
jgi:hypothetical protein